MQDKTMLQLGGAAGILGVVFIFAFFFVGPPLPGFCTDPMAQCLQAVADNRVAALTGGFFGAGSGLLMMVFLVVLYRVARDADSGIAQVGVTLGLFGFLVISLLVGTATISGTNLASLYSSASPTDKGAVVTIATAVSGVAPGGLFEIDTVLRAFGVAALGVSMVKSMNFGKRYGWLTVLVGLIYIPLDFGGLLFDPLFGVANTVFFPWLAVVGAKLLSLSRKS